MRYWIKKLSGCQFDNFFPIDMIHSNEYVEKNAQYTFSSEVSSKLNKLAKGQDLLCYIIMVSAVKILVHKLTGEDEVCMLSPAYNQQESGTEFVLLRDVIKNSMTFKEVIIAVKNTVTEAYMNQKCSYKEILNLFDVEEETALYNLLIYSKAIHYDLPDLDKKKIGICLEMSMNEDKLGMEAVYNANVFWNTTIMMIFQSVEVILKQVLTNVDTEVKEIGILSTSDIGVYNSINGQQEVKIEHNTIVKAFTNIVKQNKGAVALIFNDKEMTYQELEEKSNQVAHEIVKQLKNKNPRVGIMTERGFDMIIGLLGILKAGAAYVPIDVFYPENRIRYILENSDCDLLLIQKNCLDKRILDLNLNVLVMDNGQVNEQVSTEAIDLSEPDGLAYMIYTSGTTGAAKAVMIEHQTIMNTLSWWNNYYTQKKKMCALQLPSFSFDSSVENIFGTLLSGGKLVLIDEETKFNMHTITNVIITHNVNHILTVPSYYTLLLEQCGDAIEKLYSVTLAGEGFEIDLVKRHMEKFPNTRLYNEYGPTENSVCSTVYEFSREDNKVLIGKPITNSECFIMKKDEILPIGCVGELCVTGKGLSKGYYGNKELTDKKFVKNVNSKYGKIYRTGDIAKIMPDGNIEYHGREDSQIKIRGFRIELGEIEENIKKIPEIEKAVVLCVEDDLGEKTLHAYVVAENEIDSVVLKEQLAENLPYYMIPSQIIQVQELQMNVNGKIDREQLLQMEKMRQKEICRPVTETECRLVKIWSDVLSKEEDQISVTEDFHSLGGTSITSIVILDRIEKEYFVSIDVNEFYVDSSIRELAKVIEQKAGDKNEK